MYFVKISKCFQVPQSLTKMSRKLCEKNHDHKSPAWQTSGEILTQWPVPEKYLRAPA